MRKMRTPGGVVMPSISDMRWLLGRMNSITDSRPTISANAPKNVSGWAGEQPARAAGDVGEPFIWLGTSS